MNDLEICFTRFTTTHVGSLLLIGERPGASGFALRGIYFDSEPHAARALPSDARETPEPFAETCAQLNAYFEEKRTTFELPLAPYGTEFQKQVWMALREIPYGTTTSYAAIARSIGRPKAVRAVGAANGKNPLAIIVPCHRVIGKNGTLTGYAGGLANKEALLTLEGRTGTGTLPFCE